MLTFLFYLNYLKKFEQTKLLYIINIYINKLSINKRFHLK